MRFTYQGVLTYRGQAQGTERNSLYRITLTIDSVDDQGASGSSALTFHASDPTTDADDWDPTTDFDSWVARLGPALPTDRVSAEPVSRTLDDPPAIPLPPSPPPKQLPASGTFFIDTRAIERIRTAFAGAHAGQNPQFIDADQAVNGLYGFSFDGTDPSVFYYPEGKKIRRVSLEYDPAGFLVRMDEQIGDAASPPSATARLTLEAGP